MFERPLPQDMCDHQAYFDQLYRYWLRRDTEHTEHTPLLGLLLNPSVAGFTKGDPTTTLMTGIARRLGYSHWCAVNMNAIVATDPNDMPPPKLAAGSNNLQAVKMAIAWCDARGGDILTAWGNDGAKAFFYGDICELLRRTPGRRLLRLGKNQNGSPRFPRAIPKNVMPEEWQIEDLIGEQNEGD